MKIWPSFLIFFILLVTYPLWAVGPVIYGEDNRREVYESGDQWKSKAQGVAVLIHQSKLKARDGVVEIEQKSLRTWVEEILNRSDEEEKFRSQKLNSQLEEDLDQFDGLKTFCPEEKFTNQPVPAECTGFLIAPDLLLTAGHCASLEKFCEDYHWIFDFQLDKQTNKAPQSVASQEVYTCKRVIRQELNLSLGLDYALVQLDRRVRGKDALELENESKFSGKTKLTVIGSPTGLPLKVSGNGSIRSSLHPFFFVSTLDTYKGNSGSPVFNSSTGLVEGILVRGEDDFVPDRERMCLKSKRCEGNECQGESVSKILSIPEISYRDLLQDGVLRNDVRLISQLSEIGVWLDMPSSKGITPLMRSMKFPHLQTVEALLKEGADVRRVDQKGEEAIHFLAPVLSENSQDVLDLLLAYGANLESRNDDGETAILKAARWLNLAAVKILIQAGANYKVTNANGEGIFHSFTSISDVEAIAAIHEAIEEKSLADHGRID